MPEQPKNSTSSQRQHKNTGDYCNEDGSLKNPYMKKEKDELVQSAYRTWLSDSVKSNPLNVSDL